MNLMILVTWGLNIASKRLDEDEPGDAPEVPDATEPGGGTNPSGGVTTSQGKRGCT